MRYLLGLYLYFILIIIINILLIYIFYIIGTLNRGEENIYLTRHSQKSFTFPLYSTLFDCYCNDNLDDTR